MSIEVQEIDEKTLKNLLEKASETERRYLLEVEKWQRPGEAYEDFADIEVILGDAKMVEIEHVYDYPTTDLRRYLVVPLSVPVVIRWRAKYDYIDNRGETEKIFIFTSEGWKMVKVK